MPVEDTGIQSRYDPTSDGDGAQTRSIEASGNLHQLRYVRHDRDTKLCASSGNAGNGKREEPHATTTQSEFERKCRTLVAIREVGMPLQTEPVWGRLIAESAQRLPGALSYGTKSPGQRQPPTVSFDQTRLMWNAVRRFNAGSLGCSFRIVHPLIEPTDTSEVGADFLNIREMILVNCKIHAPSGYIC